MSNVYSLSLEGIRNAEVALERAARQIATGHNSEYSPPEAEDRIDISSSARSAASAAANSSVDYASEIIAIKAAETALKANLKVLAFQRDLDRETIDLYA